MHNAKSTATPVDVACFNIDRWIYFVVKYQTESMDIRITKLHGNHERAHCCSKGRLTFCSREAYHRAMRYTHSRIFRGFRRHIAMTILVAFSTLALFGLSFSMRMSSNGSMSNCAFMSEQASVCPMKIFEHIMIWQRMITGLVVLSVISIAFVVLAVSVLPELLVVQQYRRRRLREHSPGIALFRFLPQLFAQGILHRRVYA